MILIIVITFMFGASFGVVLASIFAAAARAEQYTANATTVERVSDRVIRDFHILRDDLGQEHIVPTRPPDTAA